MKLRTKKILLIIGLLVISFIISYIGVKYDLFILTGEERGFELENG